MPANGTILVVDDDREIVRGTMVRLANAGYNPIAAFDGLEAMDRLNHDHPDAMLLDVRMPGLDGLGVLDQLRESTEMSNLPVIMLSASLRDQNKALNAGARYFLPKPYRGEDLLQALRGVLADDTPQARQPAPQPAGPAESIISGEAHQAAAPNPPAAPIPAAAPSASAVAAGVCPGKLELPPQAEAPPPGLPVVSPWIGPEVRTHLGASAVDAVMCSVTMWLSESLQGWQ